MREEWAKHYKPDANIKLEDDAESGDSQSPAPSQSSTTAKRRPGHLSARATFDVSSPPHFDLDVHVLNFCSHSEHS